jgi:hypothetical protein
MWELLRWIVVPACAPALLVHAQAAPVDAAALQRPSAVTYGLVGRAAPTFRTATGAPTAEALQQMRMLTAIVGLCFSKHALLGAWHLVARHASGSGSVPLDRRAA